MPAPPPPPPPPRRQRSPRGPPKGRWVTREVVGGEGSVAARRHPTRPIYPTHRPAAVHLLGGLCGQPSVMGAGLAPRTKNLHRVCTLMCTKPGRNYAAVFFNIMRDYAKKHGARVNKWFASMQRHNLEILVLNMGPNCPKKKKRSNLGQCGLKKVQFSQRE